MDKATLYLILLLKVVNIAEVSVIPYGTPPPIVTTPIPTTTKIPSQVLTKITNPVSSTIKTVSTTTKTPTTTDKITVVTNSIVTYSGFLLVKDAILNDVERKDVEMWIKTKETTVFIVETKVVNTDVTNKRRRRRSVQQNLAVRFIGETSQFEALTVRNDINNTKIQNKDVLKAKIWKTGVNSCGSLKCNENVCQVNDQGIFYCSKCIQSSNAINNNNVTWTTNITSDFNSFFCPEESKGVNEDSDKNRLALIAIPCILALILLAVVMYCCCKRRNTSNQNQELDKIHPAKYDNIEVNIEPDGSYANFVETNENNDNQNNKNDDFEHKSNTFRYSNGSDILNNTGSVRGLY